MFVTNDATIRRRRYIPRDYRVLPGLWLYRATRRRSAGSAAFAVRQRSTAPITRHHGRVQEGRAKGHGSWRQGRRRRRRRRRRRPAVGLRSDGVRPEAADRGCGRGGPDPATGRALGPGETRVRQDFGGEAVRGEKRRLRYVLRSRAFLSFFTRKKNSTRNSATKFTNDRAVFTLLLLLLLRLRSDGYTARRGFTRCFLKISPVQFKFVYNNNIIIFVAAFKNAIIFNFWFSNRFIEDKSFFFFNQINLL